MNSGLSFCLAILGWLFVAVIVALGVARTIHEADHRDDMASLHRSEQARATVRKWSS